ncbi:MULTISPECIES: hypothetical protein [unclassified Brenneria]|uniref:hypothetical protein n=1 Tax=unclassified Brenneria TaxID=2634434 RepID=UPI0029C42A13|nr:MULTISPECIES: hypothetical protein [unclassified Brenneria]MDX5626468.1 hypothetical protein [Brenneria sp. L3-3Z]MDX5694182.1 hypothetical protein [Brenneria sp. L4-2C]MEE3662587.1 hypothetical protein [Brenneria sp. g21c3]
MQASGEINRGDNRVIFAAMAMSLSPDDNGFICIITGCLSIRKPAAIPRIDATQGCPDCRRAKLTHRYSPAPAGELIGLDNMPLAMAMIALRLTTRISDTHHAGTKTLLFIGLI